MSYSSPQSEEPPPSPPRPTIISNAYWERFQQLRKRREDTLLHKKQPKKRKKRLKAVCTQVITRDRLCPPALTTANKDSIQRRRSVDIITLHSPLTDQGDSGLRSELDVALEKGDHTQAVLLSDKMSERKLACQIVSAIDTHKFSKKKKEEEKRKRHKPKLQWKYEHKKRWEMKGNM